MASAPPPMNQSFSDPPPAYSEASVGSKYLGGNAAPPPPGFIASPGGNVPPPPAGYAPPPAGQAPAPPGMVYTNAQGTMMMGGGATHQGTTTVITTQPQQTVIVRMGNCPRCQRGMMVDDFTCFGICLAIFFFPLGLLCCLILRDRRCNNCGYSL